MRPLKVFLFLAACLPLKTQAQEAPYPQTFFDNSILGGGYYYSEVNYTAPSWVKNIRHKLPVNEEMSFTPGNSLELHYVSGENGQWNANLLYHPVRGMDILKPADKLVFRLLVKSNTGISALPELAIGKREAKQVSSFLPMGEYVRNFKANTWLKVEVPLQSFKGLEYSQTKEIDVISFRQHGKDQKEHDLLIDQLELASGDSVPAVKAAPKLLGARGYGKHIEIQWEKPQDEAIRYVKVYRSADNQAFQPVSTEMPVYTRYDDFVDTPGTYYYKVSFLDGDYRETGLSNVVEGKTHKMTDEQLLDMVQEANFRYYWEGAEPNSGLALENIPGRKTMVAAGASGFGVMALITGMERKFITRQEGVARFTKILAFLEKSEKFHGASSHFIDGPSGKVVPFFGPDDDGGDLVETSFLMQGLLTARNYFSANTPEEQAIRDRITGIWQGVEWDWYRMEKDSKYLYWHWSPDKEWKLAHKLIGWNETMIVYLLGISSPTHPIPASMYYSGWASQDSLAREYRKNWGKTDDGSMFVNGNTYYGIPLKVGVSNGGPLFFIHYSFLGADPRNIKDHYTDYFSNNRNIAMINYRYCIENPEGHLGYGENAWGLTASDGPWHYSANEPVAHADEGKITPTGALASFPYTPKESMQALKNYYEQYGKFLWGPYGFRDAFNLDDNWCSPIYMGLNQAPIAVMIENYRSGLLWNLFMSDRDVQEGLEKIRFETVKMK